MSTMDVRFAQGAAGIDPWPVELDAATITALTTALEQVTATIANWPADFPDAAGLAKAEQIRALLAGTLAVAGTVAVANFPATQTVDGTVDLGGATLAALETITTVISNWPSDFPDAAVLAKLEAIRALLAGTLTATVTGTVAVSNFPADQKVHDDFATESHAVQQEGADAVLTFTIAAGQMVGVSVLPATANDTLFYYACATCDGSTPTATQGFVCAVGGMTYLPAPTAGTVKVYAPAGTLVQVSGWSR